MADARSEGLRVDVLRPYDGVTLVVLAGEMDMVSSETVSRRLVEPEFASPAHVVVDLQGLTFIDSSGINALVQVVREIEAHGGTAVLAAPSATARRVFEIVRISEVVPVEDDRATALARSAASANVPRAAGDVR